MDSAAALLKALTVAFPPFDGCNHNITLSGTVYSGEVKTAPRLCLQLMSRGYFSYWLDENDFKRPVDDLIAEITQMQREALEHLSDQVNPS